MDILVFRHGIAMDRRDPGCPLDPARDLTDRGVARTAAAARGLASLEPPVSVVLTSPYLRARRTAELVMTALDLPEKVLVETDSLLPGADPSDVCDEIDALGVAGAVCVGHAPHLDLLVSYLLGAGVTATSLKKAGLAWIDTDDAQSRRGVLIGVYSPKALRRLSGD